MKILNIISDIKAYTVAGMLGFGLFGLTGCNEDFDHRLNFDELPDGKEITSTTYKVAYIVVEGGVGNIVAQEARDIGAMPTLGMLTTNAMVSWNGVSASNKETVTSYADLLTGVEYTKHNVDGDGSNANLGQYPTLFKRLATNTNLRSALITSNSALDAIVETDVIDNYELESDDMEVTEKVVEELQREDAAFVMATYSGVEQAGQISGYSSEAYKQSLNVFDQQLNRLVDAIRGRNTYAYERWLIIVTSDKGGQYTLPAGQDDGSVFSDTERNNFVVVHNSQFAHRQYERMETVDPAWTSSAVRWSEAAGSAVLDANKAQLFNFGSGAEAGDYTIQLKLKVHEMNGRNGKSGDAQNGVIMGKMKNAANFPVGWAITYNGGSGWRFVSNSGTSSNWGLDEQPFDLDTWYTLTVKLYKDGSNRTVKMFRNGELMHTVDNFSGRNLSSDDPLQIGFQEGSWGGNKGFVHSIADVRIYNTALSDDVISQIACSTVPLPSSANYADLIAYWAGNDGGSEWRDAVGKNNLDLTGSYTWHSFSERGASLCPTLPDYLERYVIRSVDMPRMIYSWFNFMNIEEFDLDSQIWNPVFTNP